MRLAQDVVLLTYRTEGSRRSSVWVRSAGSWQVRFHQGTPASSGDRDPQVSATLRG